MDDLITEDHTIKDHKEFLGEMMQPLQSASFHLRKWLSNKTEIIDGYKQEANEIIQIEKTDSV